MVGDGKDTLLDAVLRLSGLVMALVAYLAIRHLAHHHQAQIAHEPALIDFACAAIGFLGLSASAVLTLLGRHIFDQVQISKRWVRRRENDLRDVSGNDPERAFESE